MDKVKLGNIAVLINGDRGKNYPSQADITDEGEVPFVNAGHLNGRSIDFEDMNYISKEKYDRLSSGKFEKGDILYCLRGSLGKKAIVNDDVAGAIASSLVIIRPDYEKIDGDYLMFSLDSPSIKEQLVKANNGSSQPNLSAASVREYQIELPSIDVQKEVVEKLAIVRNVIDERLMELNLLDNLIKARFVELFGNIHENRFPKCKLRDVAHIKHGYAFSGEFFSDEDNGIVLVTPGNFAIGGGFQEIKNRYFTSDYDDEYVLHPGDLIVTMTDLSKRADTLGYGAIVPDSDKVYLHNQRIGLFDYLDERLNPVFVRWYMQTDEYRLEIVRTSTGSTVHHTSPDRILDSIIYLPPIDEQNKFVAFAEEVDKSKVVVQKALEKTQTLFDGLMQKYFG